MIIYLFNRLPQVFLGCSLALIASGTVVTVAFFVSESLKWPNSSIRVADIIFVMFSITWFIAILATIPAIVLVAVGEFRSVRSIFYYAIGGSIIGMGLPLIAVSKFLDLPEPVTMAIESWYSALGFVLGYIVGVIYWFIAGRNAGLRQTKVL
jgi:hypothetical protein